MIAERATGFPGYVPARILGIAIMAAAHGLGF